MLQRDFQNRLIKELLQDRVGLHVIDCAVVCLSPGWNNL